MLLLLLLLWWEEEEEEEIRVGTGTNRKGRCRSVVLLYATSLLTG